jgi:hypothetical protein
MWEWQIEDYVAREVLPFYGNTHTVTSITGNQVGLSYSPVIILYGAIRSDVDVYVLP